MGLQGLQPRCRFPQVQSFDRHADLDRPRELSRSVARLNILTDPHLTDRASPVGSTGPRRVVPPALDFATCLASTSSSSRTITTTTWTRRRFTRLATQEGGSPRYFVPLGMKPWFAARGIADVVEVDGGEPQVGTLTLTLLPSTLEQADTLGRQSQPVGRLGDRIAALSLFPRG